MSSYYNFINYLHFYQSQRVSTMVSLFLQIRSQIPKLSRSYNISYNQRSGNCIQQGLVALGFYCSNYSLGTQLFHYRVLVPVLDFKALNKNNNCFSKHLNTSYSQYIEYTMDTNEHLIHINIFSIIEHLIYLPINQPVPHFFY